MLDTATDPTAPSWFDCCQRFKGLFWDGFSYSSKKATPVSPDTVPTTVSTGYVIRDTDIADVGDVGDVAGLQVVGFSWSGLQGVG